MGLSQRATQETVIQPKKLEADIGPYLVVVPGANPGGVKLPTAADQNFMGVTLEDGKSGEYRAIALDGGIVPVTASGAIAEGAWVSVAGVSGKIKTAAPAAGSNTYALGKAMQAAAADGDVIGVLFMPCVIQG